MDETKNTSTVGGEPGDGRMHASRFDSVKRTVADKLHDAAGAIRNKSGASEPGTGFSRYGGQASDFLDRSAHYVQEFDYERVNAQVKQYVRHNPGRSLLMAGVAGLIIGAMVKRR